LDYFFDSLFAENIGNLLTAHCEKVRDCSSMGTIPFEPKILNILIDLIDFVPNGPTEAKKDLQLGAFASKFASVYTAFCDLGDSTEARLAADKPQKGDTSKLEELIRALSAAPPDASSPCSLQEAVVSGMNEARLARDESIQQIVQAAKQELEEHIDNFEPMALGGTEPGLCWKDGLDDTATLDSVMTHAKDTIQKVDGADMHSKWTTLKTTHQTAEKIMNKYIAVGIDAPDVLQELQSQLAKALTLIQKGRVTMTEAIILEDPTNKDLARKQIRLISAVKASSEGIHPAIYAAMQKSLRK